MSIKIICNVCGEESKLEDGMLFTGELMEILPNLSGELSSQKKIQKTTVHACKKCFTDKLQPILYGKI